MAEIFNRYISCHPVKEAVAAVICAIALCSCANRPHTNSAEIVAAQYANHGYPVDQKFVTSSIRETWLIDDKPVDISLICPSGLARYPLIVYLPGLGEQADAALKWRRFWAESGYAVLTFQPMANGSSVWSSSEARSGQFEVIAKEQFSIASLAQRLHTLSIIGVEIQRRQEHGEGLFEHIDSTRMAIVGFDLGAQTAMAAAGENIPGLKSLHFSLPVKAVIALSPYADLSGTLEDRYSTIRLPVLSVTSDNDGDNYGLIKSAAARSTPFKYMSPGDKYLFSLRSAIHSELAGSDMAAGGNGDGRKNERQEGNNTGAKQARRGGARKQSSDNGNVSARQSASIGASNIVDPIDTAKHAVAVQLVTTAFLNATVKQDLVAREWLAKDAARWLEPAMELSSK